MPRGRLGTDDGDRPPHARGPPHGCPVSQRGTDLAQENAELRKLLRQTTRAFDEQMEELAAEKELAQVTLASIGDGVVTTDAEGRVQYLNPVAEELTGWRRPEAAGRPLGEILHLVAEDGDERPLELPLADHLPPEHRVYLTEPTLLVRRDGQRCPVESSSAPIRDRDGRAVGSVIVFQDVSDRRLMALQLAHQASHDPLTGLLNRTAFDGSLSRALALTRRQGQTHSLAYLDLDQFKVVNDTCGHFAGDELLRQVADLLRARMRENDVVARLGGDEFAVLLTATGLDEARGLVERIHAGICGLRFTWQQSTFAVGVSIGLVEVDRSFDNLADLLSAADHACYVAKEKGRQRIQVYQPEEAEFVNRHGEMQWVVELERTLSEGRFRLFAQPIRPLKAAAAGDGGGDTAGDDGGDDGGDDDRLRFEVLLRIVDEAGTIHAGSDFIRAAERYGLMRRLDRWVVTHTLEVLASLPPEGRERVALCAVNLSALSLGDEEFLDFLDEAVATGPLPPDRLCFELTETTAVANLPQAQRLIDQLGRRGCSFALDDFGSGMSSYGYLRDLELDYLKIAGHFVSDMVTDRLDRAMVESIHQVGHVMGLATVAEYVSSQATVRLLREIGIDYGQGNWLAAPRPLPELLAAD